MGNTRLPKHALNYKPRGRRDRGPPQERMVTRRCQNRSNDLIHGGRWWWLFYNINYFAQICLKNHWTSTLLFCWYFSSPGFCVLFHLLTGKLNLILRADVPSEILKIFSCFYSSWDGSSPPLFSTVCITTQSIRACT